MLGINECSNNNGGCSANAQCINIIGGTRICTCNTRYTGGGVNSTGNRLTFSPVTVTLTFMHCGKQ